MSLIGYRVKAIETVRGHDVGTVIGTIIEKYMGAKELKTGEEHYSVTNLIPVDIYIIKEDDGEIVHIACSDVVEIIEDKTLDNGNK